MYTAEEIADFAAATESYHVERKRNFKPCKSAIEEAICAFSNDLPGSGRAGVVLIGVEDDGTPSNLAIDDRLLTQLTAIRSEGQILPFPQISVREMRLKGVPIAVVEVTPSQNTPIRLRGSVRVRVGPRRDTATRDEERVLTERRRSFDRPYDQTPIPSTSLEDLDLELFRSTFLPAIVDPQTLASNNRTVPEQLASLHLASPDAVVNVSGVVMLGHSPITWVPGAYIQFLRIDGTQITDPIVDQQKLIGPAPIVLNQADMLIRGNIRTATKVSETQREQRQPDYPFDAIQQLLRNAVIHRNYETSNAPTQWYWFSDRIEIHNPGGLFGRATPSTFGTPGGNDYRNPTLATLLSSLGYVQKFGLGIPMARAACDNNGNPDPTFEPGEHNFKVELRPA